ncbi:cytochrome P450 ClCP1 [Lindgomyces ingoldianus]|uniref:Cytochrome P450 ClCP1 n=1 Tax=Lindgomyces ingoldianus TaxID=673940 RepID=A0ACB6QAK3_9PLEO|nr:cytochrome P450 ClCP1 [Lindgomyces ingoldianus]KAF2463993.1 cytochrome P450 ClCP1 [Lindgomyces ingoldianus]
MIHYLFQGGILSNVVNAAVLLTGGFFGYVIIYGLYNITLHPLRSYPGPLLWCAYRFPWTRSVLSGRFPFDALELHKKYGPVVRVAPWELSYTDSSALKAINGHHNPSSEGFGEFPKDHIEYQKPLNGIYSLLGANGPDHGRCRRLLSHSFSDQGIRAMQPRIQSYADLLVRRLVEAAGTGYIDILKWYNWTTFDMIGDLAFGESFHCLETGQTDPWIAAIFGNMKAIPFIQAIRHYNLNLLLPWLTPKKLLALRKSNYARTDAKIDERIGFGTERGDFWDVVIAKSDFEKGTGMTVEEMKSNASLLVLAGSETTATLLSGTTYLLLRNPDAMKKLIEEVRGAFKHEDEMDLMSVGKLDYMLAVLDEAMRIYPPVPNQGNRRVPSPGAMVAGKWVPGGTSLQVQQYAANHIPSNFTRPEDFVPDRWFANPPNEFANDDRAARAPFSFGPRNCIGRNLAYAEMRLILAKVCFNFDLELDESRSANWIGDQKVFALWEKHPLYVRLTTVQH